MSEAKSKPKATPVLKAKAKSASKTAAKPSAKSAAKSAAAKKPAARPRVKAAAARKPSGPTTSKPVAPDPVAGSAPGGLPVFYKAPNPLNAERHAAAAIRRDIGHGFAAGVNSVPLNAAEFPLAARHYPILFSGGEPAMGLALLGLRDDQNLFVDANGVWEAGAYVPAYVRRYPFVLMDAGQDDRFILCIDEEAPHYSADGDGEALFNDEAASEITNRALEFCKVYQQQSEYTRRLGGLLGQHGLLTPNRANLTLQSGETLALGGFRMVDAKALEALDDRAFLDLRKAGALPLLYAQISSTSNWGGLVARDQARSG